MKKLGILFIVLMTGLVVFAQRGRYKGPVGSSDIADDAITEAELKAVNSATDEDIFTYENTTGDFEWHTLAELGIQSLDADLTTLSSPTAWRLFYSNGSSVITELTLGADGTFLESNGASAAPAFRALAASDIPDISATYQTAGEYFTTSGAFFDMNDSDVSQPFTGAPLSLPATTYTRFEPISGTAGGLQITGVSDALARAVQIRAYVGAASSNMTTPAFEFRAGKWNGATGYAPLGAGEAAFYFSDNDGDPYAAIDGIGNILINTLTGPTANGGGVLILGNVDANSVTLGANTSGIYADNVAASSEMMVMDEADNETQISPHDPVTGEWIFYSKNQRTGKEVRINMEQLVKAVERLTGEKFMFDDYMEGREASTVNNRERSRNH